MGEHSPIWGIYGLSDKAIAEKTNTLLKQLNFRQERNTMVKISASGMKQKLAFSVAIFMNPGLFSGRTYRRSRSGHEATVLGDDL